MLRRADGVRPVKECGHEEGEEEDGRGGGASPDRRWHPIGGGGGTIFASQSREVGAKDAATVVAWQTGEDGSWSCRA